MRTYFVLLDMRMKSTKFRASLYRVLDHIENSGEAVEIERNGKWFRLEAMGAEKSKLDGLLRRPLIVGDPEDLVDVDWSQTWNHDLP